MIANNLEPFEPTHPGELIKDELEAAINLPADLLLNLQAAYNMQKAK